ncbi:hypothetical protein [Georgenia deserti]|uniref:Uncharacterized protein n=1 Tax=Georgenia deserti TaxID=2093781 RepID=A0ABW4L0D5_9MICO
MAAAVADGDGCDAIRERLRALVRRPRARLHWRDEEDADRLRISQTVGACDLTNVVVVGTPVDPKRQERARRKCTERLFHELHSIGVTRVFMETRTQALNARDVQMIEAMRGAQSIPRALRVEFARPLEEPMLWIPDAVAGAVAAGKKGTGSFIEPIRSLVDEHTIDL